MRDYIYSVYPTAESATAPIPVCDMRKRAWRSVRYSRYPLNDTQTATTAPNRIVGPARAFYRCFTIDCHYMPPFAFAVIAAFTNSAAFLLIVDRFQDNPLPSSAALPMSNAWQAVAMSPATSRISLAGRQYRL